MKKLQSIFLSLLTITLIGCSQTAPSSSSLSSQIQQSSSENTSNSSIIESSSIIKSDDTSLNVKKVFNYEVNNNEVAIFESDIRNLYLNKENVSSFLTYDLHDKATMKATFINENNTAKIKCDVTAEDGSTQTHLINLRVINVFKSHASFNYGSENDFTFDYDKLGYVLEKQSLYKHGAFYYDGTNALLDDIYSFSVDVDFTEYETGGEFLIELMSLKSLEIRLDIRVTDNNKALIFTDYRDKSNYLAYKELISEISLDNTITLSTIANKGDFLLLVNNELMYRRNIPDLIYSQPVISGGDVGVVVSNITYDKNEESVLNSYQTYLTSANYTDPMVTKSLIDTGAPGEFTVDPINKTISISRSGKSSSNRAIASLANNGTPVAGTNFVVSGDLETYNTGNVAGYNAGKIEFQVCVNFSNYIKIYIYRYPTNNSIYVEAANKLYPNKKVSLTRIVNNTLDVGDSSNTEKEYDWTCSYKVIYDNGDVYFILDNELIYKYESGWGYANYIIGVTQYADVIWSNFNINVGHEYSALQAKSYNTIPTTTPFGKHYYTNDGDENVFTNDSTGYFVKTDPEETKTFLYDSNNKPIAGNKYYAKGKLTINDYTNWGQGKILIEEDELNAIHYTLEFTEDGKLQIFTMVKNNSSNWINWKAVVNPDYKFANNINFGIIYDEGTIYFLIEDEVYHTYEGRSYSHSHLGFGGKNAMVKIKDIETSLDETTIDNLVTNLTYHKEVSAYEDRIVKYEQKYADYPDGGLALIGSSSLDYWYTFQEDLPEFENITNYGIGGTTVAEWHKFMMERLTYKHNPSKILCFIGGNDVNGGRSVEDTTDEMKQLVSEMHTRLPDAHIYILLQKPFVATQAKLNQMIYMNNCYIESFKDTSYITIIENWDNYLNEDGSVNSSLFTDGMHLTTEGYKIWTAYIRKGLGLDI